MLANNNIKALTFDTGGTILDWHSGFNKGFEKLRLDNNFDYVSEEMANLFRRTSLNIVTNQKEDNLINFDDAHKLALEDINNNFNLNLSSKDLVFLYRKTPAMLRVWPDFLNAFNKLKRKFLCVSFTLLSNRLVYENSKSNHIDWDLVLSCETLEVYKPNIEAYTKTAKLLQLEPKECLMVACHSFDLNAAKKAGFMTAFVKRPLEWGNNTTINVDGEYNFVVDTFEQLLTELN